MPSTKRIMGMNLSQEFDSSGTGRWAEPGSSTRHEGDLIRLKRGRLPKNNVGLTRAEPAAAAYLVHSTSKEEIDI
jgi:hypothetical protein